MILWLANLVSAFLPQTRFFGIRRAFYRLAGVTVHDQAMINGTVRIVYPNAQIGKGTWLGAYARILPTVEARITIGNNCDVGPGVMFVAGSHVLSDRSRRAGAGDSRPITIGDGTWVGARSTFLGGSSVGSGCMVAAGTLVRGEFPDNVMIAGTPARVIRHLD